MPRNTLSIFKKSLSNGKRRMIFYTLLSNYQDSDKANLVLTAMIVYIIIYIALPEAWNGYALAAISILDYMALKLPPFDNIFKYISTFSPLSPLNWLSVSSTLKPKSKSKSSKSKSSKSKSNSKSKKHKKVRFSAKNQYHEYNPWGQMSTPGSGLGSGAMTLGTGVMPAPGAALNIPDWMLTPQQRLIKAQQTTRLNQLKQLQKPGFFIDNRHLTINTDSESSDESIASDESSELSNWEVNRVNTTFCI